MSVSGSDELAEDEGFEAATSGTGSAEASHLDARYGRSRKPDRSRRRRVIAVGATAGAIALGWIVWAALSSTDAQLNATDVSHALRNDERQVDLSWQLSVRPGTATSCIVKALNDDFTVVGWKVIDVPASDREIRVLNTTLNVALPANTVLVDRCWIP